MQIDKDTILQLLRSRGQTDQADRAAGELPDQVDTDRDSNLLDRLGIDVGQVIGALGSGGGGDIAGKLGKIIGR
jgi:hypothetical protein